MQLVGTHCTTSSHLLPPPPLFPHAWPPFPQLKELLLHMGL